MKPTSEEERSKSVALVGFGPSMKLHKTLPDDIPIWTPNASEIEKLDIKRIDRVIDIHKLQDLILDKPRTDRLLEKHDYPIYMQDEYSFFPSVTKYPLTQILEEVFENIYVGDKHAAYFDSSFPYMVALAVSEGYKVIYVFGFELKEDTEYRYQRVGAALLIGWAGGKGVKIYLPEGSGLLPRTLYGYTDYQSVSRQTFEREYKKILNEENRWLGLFNQEDAKLRERRKIGASEDKLQEAQEDWEKAYRMMYMHAGALQIIDFFIDQCDRKEHDFMEFQDMFSRSGAVKDG